MRKEDIFPHPDKGQSLSHSTSANQNGNALLSADVIIETPTAPGLQETEDASVQPAVEMFTGFYEVELLDGEKRIYSTPSDLREAILAGEVHKICKARLPGGQETSVAQIVENDFGLKLIYEPMWAYISKGFLYGMLAGIALKSLDTVVMLSIADSTGMAGIMFLLVVSSLFLTHYFKYAPLLAVIISVKAGFKANFFFMFLGAAFVGTLFGGPLGALIGAAIAHFRKNSLPKAPDSVPEGTSPYWWGIFAPILFLTVATLLYIFWLLPKAFGWISAGH